ncbi:MAG: hypothetical protein AB1896_07510 [Thermodesulfobacteriota bacterium]
MSDETRKDAPLPSGDQEPTTGDGEGGLEATLPGAAEAAPDLLSEIGEGPVPPAAPGETERISDRFQPFYGREARGNMARRALLFVLLVGLGLWVLGLVVDSFIKSTPFRLEYTGAALCCFLLIGLLWKIISLEAKTGLAALTLGLLLAINQAAFSGLELDPVGLPAALAVPIFYCLALAAALLAAWLLWPAFKWPPLVLTLLILYGALAAALPLAAGGADLAAVVKGPALMGGWPIWLRPGWLTVQVFLPLGVLLFFILQVRVLLRPQYDKHWGFLFWALCLVLAAATGLVGLERTEAPVFPKFGPVIARVYPEAVVAAAAGPPPAEPAAPRPEATPPVPVEPPAAPIEVQPETAAPSGPAAGTETAPSAGMAPPPEEETAAAPAVPAPLEREPEGTAEWQRSLESLRAEVRELREALAAQQRLLETLLGILQSRPPEPVPEGGPGAPPPPLPPREELTPAPAPPAPPLDRDVT